MTEIGGNANEEVDLAIDLRVAGLEQFLALPTGTGEVYRMGRRSSGRRLTIWSYEFAGWVEAREGQAVLALVEPEGPRFDRGLENFLRVLTASFILEHAGLLVHGAAVVRGGQAHIFFGPSGIRNIPPERHRSVFEPNSFH